MTLFVLLGALGSPVASASPASTMLPGVAYDAVIGLLAGPLVVAVHDRYTDEERFDW
jgi:hypothetical protein